MTDSSDLKKCKTCGEIKSKNLFHKDKSRPDGHNYHCAKCTAIKNKDYWAKNGEKFLGRNRSYKKMNLEKVYGKAIEYKKNNRAGIILMGARSKSIRKGLKFNLAIKDIIIPTHCPLLGIKLEYNGYKKNRDASPSIDRIDPQRGYVKGNIKIISYRANRIKNDASPEELKLIAERIDDYAAS